MFYDGVLLTKTGMKKVVSAFEKKMQTTIFCESENENLSIPQIIFSQVQQYKRFGSGEQSEYKPFYGK